MSLSSLLVFRLICEEIVKCFLPHQTRTDELPWNTLLPPPPPLPSQVPRIS